MGKFDRRSRDQKRKAKLKKRAARTRKHESLAYRGNKYKTAEYVMAIFHTERGIYESFVMCDRKLTDNTVEAALERLIHQMREGPLPPLEEPDHVTFIEGEEEDLIIQNIRRNWEILAEEEPLPRRDDLIGVLRTILNSLEIWRSESMHSQGYLNYLEGFMKKAGVSIRQVTEDNLPIPEPEEDELLEVGRDWIEGDDEDAAEEFAEEIKALLDEGEAERVIAVCQQLLGETENMAAIPRLEAFALMGHQALKSGRG